MRVWILRETVHQFGQELWRHSMLPARSAADAIRTLQPHCHGLVSVVGEIVDRRDHYYSPAEWVFA